LYFQALDNKRDCYGFFYEGSLSSELTPEAKRTWRYSPNLGDTAAEFAYLYCNGKDLKDVCPEHLIEDFAKVSEKMLAFLKTFELAKVSLSENCFYDLVPEKFLLQYFNIKNEITRHIFENTPRPDNYEFLADLDQLLIDISQQPLEIDKARLRKFYHLPAGQALVKKLSRNRTSVQYNLFGTKTGRLTTETNSFPILTLKKELRSTLAPKNDWFVEFDYNAAELRTLLALSGKDQPLDDLHEWNAKNIYRGLTTRAEAKKRIFAWLYNPESTDYLSERAYDRSSVVKKYYNGAQVSTFFGRVIPADEHHALNYIIQSTASDLFLRKAVEIDKMLKGCRTQIAFLLHDALVLDFSAEDMPILKEILAAFPRTALGDFKTNVSAGPDLGNMTELIWKQS